MNKKFLWTAAAVLVVGLGGYGLYAKHAASSADAHGGPFGPRGDGRPLPVQAATARRGEMDVSLSALGTVTALNTATVKARVDGQLVRIRFQDGDRVKAGDVLAEIDPRPYQVLLDQSIGQLERDQALLANARIDLTRYRKLLEQDSISKQQVDTQAALVQQYAGTVKTDQANVDNNRLQLGFTRITAPITGRLGLRQLDNGNMIHGSDTTGLVVITQTQPIYVLFAIPAEQLAAVRAGMKGNAPLQVQALDRDGKTVLATGKLTSTDNQIDTTTGTVKLKAEFANGDDTLFPNQFVNARLRVASLHDAVIVPAAAIQRGAQGTFLYVVGSDNAVAVRQVELGNASGDEVAVTQGLAAGEQVVIDGTDKLRAGAHVTVSTPGAGREPAGKPRDGNARAESGAGAPPASSDPARPESAASAAPDAAEHKTHYRPERPQP